MSAQSLFSKKNIQSQQVDTRRGILEELNLPPELIAFIRKNGRNLQVALICVVILVLGWVFYNYYTEMQEKKGASLLASGLQTEDPAQRVQVLETVIRDYGRTDAALWSRIELAHLDYKDGKFEAASAKYKETVDRLSADNPLLPLTRLNLAQSYEQAGQYEQAIAQYNLLKKNTGFANQAYLGLGRIYMAKEDPVQARNAYEQLLSSLDETPDPVLVAQIEAKLASLDSGQTINSPEIEDKKD